MSTVLTVQQPRATALTCRIGPVVRRLQASYASLAARGAVVPAFSLTLDDGSIYRFGTGETAFEVAFQAEQ